MEVSKHGLQLGFAVKSAVKAGAYLAGANLEGTYLAGAYLAGANLAGANLEGANLIDAGQRSDGHRFVGAMRDGVLRIHAGCRDFTVQQAYAHWGARDYRDQSLGAESLARVALIVELAKARG